MILGIPAEEAKKLIEEAIKNAKSSVASMDKQLEGFYERIRECPSMVSQLDNNCTSLLSKMGAEMDRISNLEISLKYIEKFNVAIVNFELNDLRSFTSV